MSHPTMGAWIEIRQSINRSERHKSRTPRWVRGLKSPLVSKLFETHTRRTPRWVRGLKLDRKQFLLKSILSHPTMGAWIEIINSYELDDVDIVAPHDGCVD